MVSIDNPKFLQLFSLKKALIDLTNSYYQNRIIFDVAKTNLDNFPNKLTSDLKQVFFRDFLTLIRNIKNKKIITEDDNISNIFFYSYYPTLLSWPASKFSFDLIMDSDDSLDDRISEIKQEPIDYSILPLEESEEIESSANSAFKIEIVDNKIFLDNILYNELKKIFDFDRILPSFELVFLYAKFEAFLNDCLHVIYNACPQTLKSKQKDIDFEKIIELGSYENIISYMIEDQIFKTGKKDTIPSYLSVFRKFGFNFDEINIDEDTIRFFKKIRNLILHNGSKVNQDFLDYHKKSDIKIGDYIGIVESSIFDVAKEFNKIADFLFNQIIEKFFKDEVELVKELISNVNQNLNKN